MAAYLITGNPGSGKSELARELNRLGQVAVDTDDTIAGWASSSGEPVDRPADAPDTWLSSHRWVWDRTRLESAILLPRPAGRDLFFCGIALNQRDMLDLFDRVFLLAIDEATQVARLDTPSNAGRGPAARQQILSGRPVFEAEMTVAGAEVLDGGRPTAELALHVLAAVSAPPAR